MKRLAAAASFVFALVGGSVSVVAQTVTLDDFESGTIRVVQPLESVPALRFLWNQYEGDFSEGPDPGLAEIVSDTAYDGTRSLRVRMTGGNLYLQLYPHNGSYWQWMRDFVQPSEDWKLNTFNRMRFWIKVPSQIWQAPPGQANLQFGTYVRRSDGDVSSAESGGNHYYHLFNVPYTGEWHQVIVDTHPNHVRGANGAIEHGDKEYPTGEPAFNYFDALTRFYIDFMDQASIFPIDFFVDRFEFYRETRPENITQIYSLNGVYVPSTNTVMVRWMRHKDENLVNHEVRYAFQDIHTLGWASATPAPNGTITPPGWTGYNGMEWSSNTLNLVGRTMLYVAIKPQNSASFRQIMIPLVRGTGQAPVAPGNPRIVS